MHHDRESWDERYASGQCPHDGPASRLLRRWILRLPRGRALDIATGLGRNAIFLARAGYRVDAVDVSPVGLRIAKARARRVDARIRWIEADLDTWAIPRSRYAVVVDAFYLNRRRLPALKASVKPGGVLLLEAHLRRMVRKGKPVPRHFGVHRGELRRWFRGWEILHLEEGRIADGRRVHFLGRVVARRPG